MSISSTRFFQSNSELFSRLSSELKTLQTEAGTGKATLKLSESLGDVSKLSAGEEKASEINQYMQNAKRVQRDLEGLDLAFERLQNLTIRLQELSVESANDVMLPEERARFALEANMIKSEIIDVANSRDSFGNTLFGGIAGETDPFEISKEGTVTYVGSHLNKSLKVTPGLHVKQNYAGSGVFSGVAGETGQINFFEVIDDLIDSLSLDLNSDVSSNIFNNTNMATLKFMSSGAEVQTAFELVVDGYKISINENVYGNDFTAIAEQINQHRVQTGITASFTGDNQLVLQGTADNVVISGLKQSDDHGNISKLRILDQQTGELQQELSAKRFNNAEINTQITDVFEHFASLRAEVGASSRRAQEAETAQQDILISLEESMSDIRDADLAQVLTKIEFLMTQKEAAQATFTRLTGRSLFDLLG